MRENTYFIRENTYIVYTYKNYFVESERGHCG